MADGSAPVLALYRRYRPDTFEQVVGQDHAVGPITAALSKGRVNHAYLFSGPRGCGKTTSARVLARSLNCVQGPTPTPCLVCPSCVDLANGSTGSLDVIEIDAASHRGIDDARDLRDRVAFSPVRDRYKVVIIDEAHQITADAFSALLKVVEEPPEHVVFVFATTEPEKVLGTIRSRTHHFPFRLVPPARLLQHLQDICRREDVVVEPAALSLVVRAGGGSVRDSMSVLDQLIAGADGAVDAELATALLGYVPESLLDDLVDALAAVDGAAAFASVHHAVEAGHDPRRYTNDLLERLRTLVIVSRVGEGAATVLPEVPEDAFERLRHQASRFGYAELSRAADVVAAALGEMAGATSPRLLLELLVARLLVVGADADGAVTTRVERLERQLVALGEGGALPPSRGARQPAEAAPARRTAPAPAVAAPAAGLPAAAQHPGPRVAPSGPSVPDHSADPDHAPARAVEPDRPASRAVGPDRVAAGSDARDGAVTPDRGPAPADRTVSAAAPTAHAPVVDDGWPDPVGPSSRGRSTGAGAGHEQDRPVDARPDDRAVAQGQPAEQRPAAATQDGRSGRPPADEAAPSRGTATVALPPVPGGHADPGSGVTVEVVRRTWDQVVDRLRTIRRLTWTLVSENAQVLALDTTSLTLGFPTQGLADAFNQRGHSDCVKEALLETLGVERKAVGVVGGRASGAVTDLVDDGPTDDGPEPEHVSGADGDLVEDGWPAVTGPSARSTRPAHGQVGHGQVGHGQVGHGQGAYGGRGAAGDRAGGRSSGRGGPGGAPGGDAAPPGSPASQGIPTGPADAPVRTRPRVEAIPPEPPVDDTVSRDDPSVETGGGADVLTRLLGAQVIEDRRTDG